MRSDINILWIEDSSSWQKKAEELFRLKIDDLGLLTEIKYISKNIRALFDQIKNEAMGYKVYDIIFIDYNISGEEENDGSHQNITGDKIIEEFRKYNIDADILFYSENLSDDQKKEIILNSTAAFDGIYLASRKDFQENALKLYRKNIRKLTSMLNIRGLLTDKTSENDYVVHSYLQKKYDGLPEDRKKKLSELLAAMIADRLNLVESKTKDAQKLLNKLKNNESCTMKKLCSMPDFLFSITMKYRLLSEMLMLDGSKTFSTLTMNDYYDKIIKTRNTVAHKKLDICKQQKYLKYYDSLNEYRERGCLDDCSSHTNDYKISLEEWQEILILANNYSKLFDSILKELERTC